MESIQTYPSLDDRQLLDHVNISSKKQCRLSVTENALPLRRMLWRRSFSPQRYERQWYDAVETMPCASESCNWPSSDRDERTLTKRKESVDLSRASYTNRVTVLSAHLDDELDMVVAMPCHLPTYSGGRSGATQPFCSNSSGLRVGPRLVP